VFLNFGPELSFDVANVLLHAHHQKKTEEVLEILEKHWEEHLYFQHPEARGRVSDRLLGINPTKAMFQGIYQVVLELQSVV